MLTPVPFTLALEMVVFALARHSSRVIVCDCGSRDHTSKPVVDGVAEGVAE